MGFVAFLRRDTWPNGHDRLTACCTVALVQVDVGRLWVAADQVRVPALVPDCYPAEEESGRDPDRMGRTEQWAVALVCLFPLSSSSVLLRWLNEWTDQGQLLFRVWLDTRGRVTKSAL